MARIIDTLACRDSVRLFLFGAGEKEREQIGQWCAGHGNVVNMAAFKSGFATELPLMSHLDLMLSMDSANMHLAAIAGAPTLSIWGATHPFAGFTAWRQPKESMLGAEMECRPCSVFGDRPCRYGDYRCLRAISPDEVVRRIDIAIAQKK